MARNIKQESNNVVNIVGKLLDCTITEGISKRTGNKYASAKATVRVTQAVDGQEETSEILVSMIATPTTSTGKPSPVWESIQELRKYKTVQDYGESEADTVRFTQCRLEENNYVTRNGTFVHSWQASASFVRLCNNIKPTASFSLDSFILDIKDEIDNEGEETGRMILKAGVVRWNEKLDVLDLVVENPQKVDYLRRTLNVNDTINLCGRIRVTSKEEARPATHSSWGEEFAGPSTTRKVQELIVTGGANEPFEEEFAYDPTDIKKLFNERKALVEQQQMDASKRAQSAAKEDKRFEWE